MRGPVRFGPTSTTSAYLAVTERHGAGRLRRRRRRRRLRRRPCGRCGRCGRCCFFFRQEQHLFDQSSCGCLFVVGLLFGCLLATAPP